MKSKITQISTVAVEKKSAPYLYALCEDGSVWRKFGTGGEWVLASEPFQKQESSSVPLPILGGK